MFADTFIKYSRPATQRATAGYVSLDPGVGGFQWLEKYMKSKIAQESKLKDYLDGGLFAWVKSSSQNSSWLFLQTGPLSCFGLVGPELTYMAFRNEIFASAELAMLLCLSWATAQSSPIWRFRNEIFSLCIVQKINCSFPWKRKK